MKSRLCEWSIESIHGLFIPAWNQMSITIHGDLDRRMPHLLFDVDRALAVLEQERSERMAEIMEAHPSQLGLRQQPIKHTISNVMWMKQASFFARKDPEGDFGSCCAGVDLSLKQQVLERLGQFPWTYQRVDSLRFSAWSIASG